MTEALRHILDLRKTVLPRIHVDGDRVFNTDWRTTIELFRAVDLAEMVVRSALFRKESRGHHFRSDFPHSRQLAQHTLGVKTGDGLSISFTPVNTRNA